MLAPLLAYAADDAATTTLARDGGDAFVSLSLRPFVVAALAQQDAERPLLVVAGDDRQARDLAADLRTWLSPRQVRFYPSRGVAYESHLAPPPHLVGLRVAALDALVSERAAGTPAPVVVVSAVALSEKVPDPALRPRGFVLEVGELMDLDETAQDLVAAGYERVDQVEDRGQFAIRGGLLDLYPATEDRAVRVDLFGDEVESLRWFSTFTQRSLGDAERIEVSPAAELAPEHRELAEIAALGNEDERPDIAELLPVGDFHAMLDLVPDAAVLIAAEEEIAPALSDHWTDVCTAFHAEDAHDLYVAPDAVHAALAQRGRIRLTSIDGDQAHRVPRPERRRRRARRQGGRAGAGEARARRLPHGRRLRPQRRGRARRLQPRPHEGPLGRRRRAARRGPRLRRGAPARRLRRARLQTRGDPRAPALPPPPGALRRPRLGRLAARRAALLHRPAHRRHRRPRGPRPRPLRRLRHEDRRRRHARLPGARVRRQRQGLHAGRPVREDLALRRRRRRPPAALQARRQTLGHAQVARPQSGAGDGRRAAQPVRRAQAPRGPPLPARHRLDARLRGRLAVPRDARPARGDRAGQGRHGVRRGRWTA